MILNHKETEVKSNNGHGLHLANNQIPVGYTHMGTINETDVIQTHHAVLKNKASSRKFEQLSANTDSLTHQSN
jgi:hypothetical protein